MQIITLKITPENNKIRFSKNPKKQNHLNKTIFLFK